MKFFGWGVDKNGTTLSAALLVVLIGCLIVVIVVAVSVAVYFVCKRRFLRRRDVTTGA